MYGTSFFQSLRIQGRVVAALLMREIITRYGRHNIGFFWLFAEPGMFTVGVAEIWLNLHHESRGLPVVACAFTGYSTILLWRNCGNKCSQAITPNLSLLYHHNVRVIDVLFGRILLELSGCTMSFVFLFIVFNSVGWLKMPDKWTVLVEGYLLMAYFATGLATMVCACSELSEVFERVWHPITYFMLPISGLTYMVGWLPHQYQYLALYVPMVNGTEMIRDGYFGHYVHAKYSATYLALWSTGLLFGGLIFLKLFARRVEPQ